jgi:hypothetical protein
MLWLHTKALVVFSFSKTTKNLHSSCIPCLPRIGITCYNLTLPPSFKKAF